MGGLKQNRTNPNALCVSEQRIMDLWDAGRSIEQITRGTPYCKSTVSNTVSRLTDGGETRLHLAAMQSGSAALAAAIRSAAA